ncbi:hypothetical protein BDR07DRAFT_1496216 [Suillus spraguei]|nr:hypothetical protein BDR07DRAFT_1496216 [Suillus spraguei]
MHMLAELCAAVSNLSEVTHPGAIPIIEPVQVISEEHPSHLYTTFLSSHEIIAAQEEPTEAAEITVLAAKLEELSIHLPMTVPSSLDPPGVLVEALRPTTSSNPDELLAVTEGPSSLSIYTITDEQAAKLQAIKTRAVHRTVYGVQLYKVKQ